MKILSLLPKSRRPALLLPGFTMLAALVCGDAAGQSYTFTRHDFGQVVVEPDGVAVTFPNNNLWTQPYTTVTDQNGNTYPSAYTNWQDSLTFPNSSGAMVTVGPQTDPHGNAALNGAHLNENVTIQNLTLTTGGLLTVDSSNSGGAGNHSIIFTLAGASICTIQNAGTINIYGTDQETKVSLAHALTLSGSGKLGLGHSALLTGPGVLTIAAGTTMQAGGAATLSAPLVNKGTLTANGFGNFLGQNNLLYSSLIITSSVTNQATISTSGTGSLYLTGGVINNTGGVIHTESTPDTAGNFFGIVLNGGVSITGGTLSGKGTTPGGIGIFRAVDYGATLTNVTLPAPTNIRVDGVLNLKGAIANSGTITLNDYSFNPPTGPATLNVASNTTLSGSGTVNIVSRAQITVANGATLTQASTHSITGSGTMSGAINNAGRVDATAGALTVQGTTMTNSGTFRASGANLLDLNGGTYTNTGGLITSAGTGYVTLLGGIKIVGGSLSSAASDFSQPGILRVEGPTALTNVTLATGSGLRIDYPTALSGTFTNNADVRVTGFNFNTLTTAALTLSANASIAGTGTITILDGEIDSTNNAVLTLGSGQTLLGRGTINAKVVNNGNLQSSYGANGVLTINSPTLTNNGTLSTTDSTTLQQSGSSTLTNYNSGTQTLTGGTYSASATTNSSSLNLNIGPVVTNAAKVEISGASAQFPAINSLASNKGTFSLLALRQFTTPGALANTGALVLDAGTDLRAKGNYTSSGSAASLKTVIGGTATMGATSPGLLQVDGTAVISGKLLLSFATGSSLPSSSSVLKILTSSAAVTGSFSNAPNGSRLATTDGRGSFIVKYGTGTSGVTLSSFTAGNYTAPAFFNGQVSLGNGVYYLQFPNGTPFGYYSYLDDPNYIYHFDLGYEYVFDAADGVGGVYFYDFLSGHFFYTSPVFPFPYLYDFTLNATLYYYPDTNQTGH